MRTFCSCCRSNITTSKGSCATSAAGSRVGGGEYSSLPTYDAPAQFLTSDHPIPDDVCSPPSRLEMFSLLFKRFNELPVIVVKGGECEPPI